MTDTLMSYLKTESDRRMRFSHTVNYLLVKLTIAKYILFFFYYIIVSVLQIKT
jgi:hypothetical protein